MRQINRIRAAVVLALLLPAIAPAQASGQAAEQGATTRRQADKTERANRDATVADETGTLHGTPPSQAAPRQALPPYGPTLYPRGQQGQDPARKDPAEVHDETDTLSRTPAQPTQPAQPAQPPDPARKPQAAARRPAAQAAGPMAPRPLRPLEAAPSAGVPVPPPAAAPQPPQAPERGSTVVGSCPGGVCSDAAGNSYATGSNGTVISNSGRLCTRGTATVQCL